MNKGEVNELMKTICNLAVIYRALPPPEQWDAELEKAMPTLLEALYESAQSIAYGYCVEKE